MKNNANPCILRRVLSYIACVSLAMVLLVGCVDIAAEEDLQPKANCLMAAGIEIEKDIVYVSQEYLLLQDGSKLQCYSAEKGQLIFERSFSFNIDGESHNIDFGFSPDLKTVIVFQWFKCTNNGQIRYVFAYMFLDIPGNTVTSGRIDIDDNHEFNPFCQFPRLGVLDRSGEYLIVAGGVFRIIVDLSNRRVQRVANAVDTQMLIVKDEVLLFSFKEVKCVWHLAEWKEADPEDSKTLESFKDKWMAYKDFTVYPRRNGAIIVAYPKIDASQLGIPRDISIRIFFVDEEWKLRRESKILIRCPNELIILEDEVLALCGKGEHDSSLMKLKEDGAIEYCDVEYKFEKWISFIGPMFGDILIGCEAEEKVYRIDKDTLKVIGTYDMTDWSGRLMWQYFQAGSEIFLCKSNTFLLAAGTSMDWLGKIEGIATMTAPLVRR